MKFSRIIDVISADKIAAYGGQQSREGANPGVWRERLRIVYLRAVTYYLLSLLYCLSSIVYYLCLLSEGYCLLSVECKHPCGQNFPVKIDLSHMKNDHFKPGNTCAISVKICAKPTISVGGKDCTSRFLNGFSKLFQRLLKALAALSSLSTMYKPCTNHAQTMHKWGAGGSQICTVQIFHGRFLKVF